MFKVNILLASLLTAGIFLLPGQVWGDMSSSNYKISADVFGSGGDVGSASASYFLADTLGEAVANSATSTSDSYGIKAGFEEMYPDQTLTFSTSAAAIELGQLAASSVSSASHSLTVDTNADGGFTITVAGSTLTSGSNTIAALATAAAAAVGTEQFGLNLVANTNPVVGSDPAGTAPIGVVNAPFATANQFAFNDTTTQTVASSAGSTNATTYTVSYIANIASNTVSGTYTTSVTYSATANF